MSDSSTQLPPDADPGDAPLSPYAEGRLRAIDGLLYTEFGQARGTASERAMARLRNLSEAAPFADDPADEQDEPASRSGGTTTIIRFTGETPEAPQRPPSPGRLDAASHSGIRRAAYRRFAMRRVAVDRLAWIGGVAALLLFAIGLVTRVQSSRHSEVAMEIEALHGAVALSDGSGDGAPRLAQRGDFITPGMILETGTHGTVRLRYADGTALDLTGDARLVVAGHEDGPAVQKDLRLERGTVHAEVAKQPQGRPMLVTTTDAQAVVLGTRLIVAARTGATKLTVEHGLVRLVRNSDHREVEVPTGKKVIAEETGALMVQDSEIRMPAGVRPTTPTKDGSGTGLRGDYFNDMEFTQLKLTRIDPLITFDWGFESSPHPSIKSNFYAVRWTGQIEPRFSESYNFSTLSDDGVRLWIDGKLIIENWFEHPELMQFGSIDLEAGKKYAITLEFCEWKRFALVHLFWQSKHQWRELVPQSQLYPASAPVP